MINAHIAEADKNIFGHNYCCFPTLIKYTHLFKMLMVIIEIKFLVLVHANFSLWVGVE